MKNVLILFFLSTLFINAQSDSTKVKPEKVRVYSSFLSDKYEIGNKTVKEKDVINHLEKYSPRAYYDYRKGKSQESTASVLTVLGLVTLISSFATSKLETKLAIDLAAIAITIPALAISISSNKNKKNAIDFYNREYGY